MAVEYAHRHLSEVGVAWQIAAEEPAVLAASFAELAAQLGARDVADSRDPVASVHAILTAFPAGWLLIFDNVPDLASVQAYLPPAGPGRVMITSQNSSWPHRQAMGVPLLDADVAMEFLVSRAGDQDQRASEELATALGRLPLALEQAAAYLLTTGGTMSAYLDLFHRRRRDMLGRGDPAGYSKTVATTWLLAFDRLQQTSPGREFAKACGLLRAREDPATSAAAISSRARRTA